MDLYSMSALDLAGTLRRQEVSAVEVLDAVLQRADDVGPALNPFAHRLDDRAWQAALRADEARRRGEGGPLCGVPVTVKDSRWIAGVESNHGSRSLIGHVPTETCAAVQRLEDAGAVVFATTTVPEFCYFGVTDSPVFGRTSNPWDLSRTCGGSSGGSAAAVAAGIGPLSLGGDGGGSIRIPAAFCGLVGFKPTFGLVPHEPSAAAWKTLVALGPLARSVADARLMLATLAGWDPRDRHSHDGVDLDVPAPDPGRLRVLVSGDLGFAPVDDDVRRVFRATVDRLAAAGVDVVEAHPKLRSSMQAWSTIACAEARWSESEAYENHPELIGRDALDFLAFGEQFSAGDYVRAQFERERIHRAYADLLSDTGAAALLTPTLGCEAFPHGTRHPESIGGVPITDPWLDWAGFLYDANLAGLPACAVPIGLGDDGLPVSLHVLGLRRQDGTVLAVAETVESLVGFDSRPLLPQEIP
jgi:Asp-tRNA(Asn)/Glu-tRNA(Gln) amidotransferase A subunit family amidase